jgi:hypothetical protein
MCNGERGKERHQRASHPKHRGRKNYYKLVRTKERRLYRKKARQLDEEALIDIERHRSMNDVRRPFEPQVDMCQAKKGELLTNKKPSADEMERTF